MANQSADAIAMMFAVQFVFGTEAHADALLRTVSRLLRPGGVFFGVAPDGGAIAAAVEAGGGGAHAELHLKPPAHPFSLCCVLPPLTPGQRQQ